MAITKRKKREKKKSDPWPEMCYVIAESFSSRRSIATAALAGVVRLGSDCDEGFSVRPNTSSILPNKKKAKSTTSSARVSSRSPPRVDDSLMLADDCGLDCSWLDPWRGW
jgi:hypothetical protein